MASSVVIFGKVTGAQPVLDSSFSSQTIASGATSTASTSTNNYCVIVAVGGNQYAAFTTDGSTPVTSADPRFPLVDGVPISFRIKAGTKVGVVDR
jgi:hypothetical protein